MDILNPHLPTQSLTKQYAISTHVVDVEPSVTPTDALNPNFWPHLVAKFRLGHEVIVRPYDFTWRLHAEVVAIDPAGHWAMLRTISLVEGMPVSIGSKDESGFRIDHDPVQGWRILNGRDLIARDLPNEAAARAKLAEIKAGPKRRAA